MFFFSNRTSYSLPICTNTNPSPTPYLNAFKRPDKISGRTPPTWCKSPIVFTCLVLLLVVYDKRAEYFNRCDKVSPSARSKNLSIPKRFFKSVCRLQSIWNMSAFCERMSRKFTFMFSNRADRDRKDTTTSWSSPTIFPSFIFQIRAQVRNR